MPQAAAQTSTAPEARTPRVTRGMRAGMLALSTRSNVGPAESFDGDANSFEFVLATPKPVRSWRYLVQDGDPRPRWSEVEEQLVIAGAEGLDDLVGSSILNSHSYWDVEAIVGVIESARLATEGLVCTGRLSRRDGVADIARDIADGIIRSVSVGFDILEETASLREGQVPLVTIARWRPREASLVAVPADSAARIRSGAPDVTQPKTTTVVPAGGKRADMSEEDKAKAEAARAAAAAAVTAAKATLESAERALADLNPAEAEPAASDADKAKKDEEAKAAERKAHVDALRGVARGRGEKALSEFEALALTGAPVAELRTVCVSAIATSGGEISGVSAPTSAARSDTPLKTRSEYRALRAAGGR